MKTFPVNPNLQFSVLENRPVAKAARLENYNSSITFRKPVEASFFESCYDTIATFFASILMIFGIGAVTPSDVQTLATKKGFIYFYDHKNPVSAWLGNFYPTPITIYGRTFSCSEAAYQSCKFEGYPNIQAQFTNLNGDQAFRLAKKYSKFIRSDWNDVKEQKMSEVIYAKFTQNAKLRSLLVESTGSAYLVEHNEVVGRDTYWSDNHNGTGQNRLGELLMELRGQLGGYGSVTAPRAYYNFLKNR
jgi:ribA/ribD-fused uncharacterized protein